MDAGRLRRQLDLLLGGGRRSIRDVFADGAGEIPLPASCYAVTGAVRIVLIDPCRYLDGEAVRRV